MTNRVVLPVLLLVLGFTAGALAPHAKAEIIGEMKPFLQELTRIRQELAGIRQELGRKR